ncbi:glycosyl hydrolase family 32 [Nesterenkonia sp. E16_7]|uniref:glycosyl hydrolase family 32 n=1 Tax=unclassified Nesterenkonia TaxID=2629769 RepID=UPI001A9265C2|nr:MULTISPECIES: glycosyl hydrolase family 32 [unclassified Nesterenkonia]MBO0594907.1 glycosyl hydrolase family 32 [Nesterenkonia sp. E16_10]MBO0599843.1 glycosyl hydrolase family 32 [Nesterenkonia sp. E16_7]
MTFRLPDAWVWDSWLADDGENYHLFFLRASRALQNPDARHHRASIGHATSVDLQDWTPLPDALTASDGPTWDDLATWTGCTVRGPDGTWHLFYTGVSREEEGLRQRIGSAVSDDLLTWTRSEMPALEADEQWYEKLNEGTWPDEAWRDPFVFFDEATNLWQMLITARGRTGDPDQRAVVGHAVSPDLTRWETRPPLSAPAGFGEMEVIQSREVHGEAVLLFSCLPEKAPGIRFDSNSTGTWIARGESLLGSWDLRSSRSFFVPGVYAAQLFRKRDGEWVVFGFQNSVDGRFVGEIASPVALKDVLEGATLFPISTITA